MCESIERYSGVFQGDEARLRARFSDLGATVFPVSAAEFRKFYGLDDIITMRHLNNMAKVTLATGLIVAYGYEMEAFFAYFTLGGLHVRPTGAAGGAWETMGRWSR